MFVLLWPLLAPADGFNHFYSSLHLEEMAVRRRLEGGELVSALLASVSSAQDSLQFPAQVGTQQYLNI